MTQDLVNLDNDGTDAASQKSIPIEQIIKEVGEYFSIALIC